jgi:hypothetical protein
MVLLLQFTHDMQTRLILVNHTTYVITSLEPLTTINELSTVTLSVITLFYVLLYFSIFLL